MEERLAQLEESLAQTAQAVAGPSIVTQHERRIAQLEGQLQAIQMASGMSYGVPAAQQCLPPGFPSLGRGVGRDAPPMVDAHREKRARSGDDVEGDFIARGLVTEEEARTCFEA